MKHWLALAVLSLLLTGGAVRGSDTIWAAVLVANNVAKPNPPPPELQSVAGRLERALGYNQFQIVGKTVADVDDNAKLTLKPTKTFWMKLQTRRASIKEARGGYLVNLELYKDEKALVDTVALIAPASPLFFRGPMCTRGQVVVVLQVQPGK